MRAPLRRRLRAPNVCGRRHVLVIKADGQIQRTNRGDTVELPAGNGRAGIELLTTLIESFDVSLASFSRIFQGVFPCSCVIFV